MTESKVTDQIIGSQKPKIKNNRKYTEVLNKYFKPIIFLLLILILIFGYYLIIVPKWEIKSNKVRALAMLQAEVDKLKVDSEYLSKYSSQIIKFTPDEEHKLNLALPSEFDMSAVVIQLTKLASGYGFIVDNIQVNEASTRILTDDNIKRVDIELSVTSTGGNNYGNFGKFIEALESSLMIFDVRAISFTPETVGYKLELSTYYYPIK